MLPGPIDIRTEVSGLEYSEQTVSRAALRGLELDPPWISLPDLSIVWETKNSNYILTT